MDPELLDKLEKLQVLTLQPGDVLVATITRGSHIAERAAHIKDQLKQYVPDNDVMILSDVELAALRHTEQPTIVGRLSVTEGLTGEIQDLDRRQSGGRL